MTPLRPTDAEVAIDGQLICNAHLLDASANFHTRNRKARLTDLTVSELPLPGHLEFTVHDTGT